jgi:hypothetical protein
MLGRNCTRLLARLLALSLLTLTPLLTPLFLRGQSDQPSADFPFPRLGPRSGTAPREPGFPLRPILPPGAIGFQQIAHSAGTIFSGTVTGITRHPATHPQEVETVAITFHVEKAMRGAIPGQELTINQWIGLWSTGQRYHVGERVLLFLYPPSKLGLTSAVGGPIGRFSVDPLNRILLTPKHLALTQADPILSSKTRITWNEFRQAVTRSRAVNESAELTRLP